MSTLLKLFETSGITDMIFGVIGTLLYPLFSVVFTFIRTIQDVFFAFAGIKDVEFKGEANITSGNSGAEDDTGLLYYLLHHNIVKNMIISMMVLALFLMIIFTVMAFIKNAYSAKPKGWKDIIANSIKGLANFIFLPVCVLLGVWLGNILLQAINGATSFGGATSMDRKLFIASAYNANVFRCSDNAAGEGDYGDLYAFASKQYMLNDPGKKFTDKHDIEKHVLTGKDGEETDEIDPAYYEYYANVIDQIYSETSVGIHAWWDVGTYYSLWNINYLVLIVGGIFMLYVLGSLAFAMVKRLFYILVLFIVSPGVCALYPLDEGKAVGSWAGEVKKQVLSAYGAVAGMNIFFSLVPLIDKIELTGSFGAWGMADIIQIFILVSGLMVVKDLIGMLSGFVGGDNAYASGSSMMKSAAKEVGGRAGKFAAGTAGAFARAGAARKAGGSFFSSLGRSTTDAFAGLGKNALKTVTGGALDFEAIKKAQKEGKEAGKKGVQDKAKRRAIDQISDDLREQEGLYATNHTAGETQDQYLARVRGDALKRAKQAGVEKEVAGMVADRLNAGEIRNARINGDIPITNTADSVLADIKAQGEAKDAMEALTAAINRLKDTGLTLANHHVNVSDLGMTQAQTQARLARKQSYTEQEIAAATGPTKQAMINFNSAVETQRELSSDMKSAANAAQTALTAATKLTHRDYSISAASGGLKKEEIAANVQRIKDSDGTGAVSTAAQAALQRFSDELGKVTGELNATRAELIRNKSKDIGKNATGSGDKK